MGEERGAPKGFGFSLLFQVRRRSILVDRLRSCRVVNFRLANLELSPLNNTLQLLLMIKMHFDQCTKHILKTLHIFHTKVFAKPPLLNQIILSEHNQFLLDRALILPLQVLEQKSELIPLMECMLQLVRNHLLVIIKSLVNFLNLLRKINFVATLN